MSFLRKVFLVNSAEFVSLGIAILQTSVLTRALGPAGVGQYAIILSALLLTPQICSLGMPLSFLYHSQHDPANKQLYLIHAFWASLSIGIIGGLALVFLIVAKTSYFGPLPLFGLVGIGCFVPIALARVIARNTLLIRVEASKLGLMRVCSRICGIVLVLILVVFGVLTVSRAILCVVFTECAAMILGWFWIRGHVDSPVRFDWKVLRRLGSMGIRLNWADLMILANAQLNILIIRYLLDDFESVGYFSRGQRIAMLAVIAGHAILPLLFSRWASLPHEKLSKHIEKTLRFASTISLSMIVAILLFGKWLILILYGREFLPAVVPMMILVPGAVIYLLSRTLISLLGSRGIPEVSALVLLVGAIVNSGLSFLLVPRVGILGAACASTASNILLLGLLLLIAKKKYGIRLSNCVCLKRSDIRSISADLLGRTAVEEVQVGRMEP